jgi:hypothetical protein
MDDVILLLLMTVLFLFLIFPFVLLALQLVIWIWPFMRKSEPPKPDEQQAAQPFSFYHPSGGISTGRIVGIAGLHLIVNEYGNNAGPGTMLVDESMCAGGDFWTEWRKAGGEQLYTEDGKPFCPWEKKEYRA